MSGYAYGSYEPTKECPYCGMVCRADFVDIGVGFTQCGPYHCESCGASERGPYDSERPLSEMERSTGWYAPDTPPGSSANVINGRVVSHVQMRDTYRLKWEGNPLYNTPGAVEAWWESIR